MILLIFHLFIQRRVFTLLMKFWKDTFIFSPITSFQIHSIQYPSPFCCCPKHYYFHPFTSLKLSRPKHLDFVVWEFFIQIIAYLSTSPEFEMSHGAFCYREVFYFMCLMRLQWNMCIQWPVPILNEWVSEMFDWMNLCISLFL